MERDKDPISVGHKIRELLLGLGETMYDKYSHSYSNNELRAQALEAAGFCWKAKGELRPGCCCEWTPPWHGAGPDDSLSERVCECICHTEDNVTFTIACNCCG